MAREVIITDDLDGSPSATPVRFGFHDKQYEIDLSGKNEAQLAQLLARYIDHGREVTPPPAAVTARRRGAGKRPGREDLTAIREWAKQKGLKVSDRGRISADIIEQYDAAHSKTRPSPDRPATTSGDTNAGTRSAAPNSPPAPAPIPPPFEQQG
jgi:hypothetical protein